MTSRDLVYGHAWFHGCLAFVGRETALGAADEIVAIATASTWREAASIATEHVWNPVAALLEDEDPDFPDRDWDAPFAITEVGAVQEGDWPPMVTARSLHDLPDELPDWFGEESETIFNGPYLDVPLEREAVAVAWLQDQGFTLMRDDNLINVLDGRTFNPIERVARWPLPTSAAGPLSPTES